MILCFCSDKSPDLIFLRRFSLWIDTRLWCRRPWLFLLLLMLYFCRGAILWYSCMKAIYAMLLLLLLLFTWSSLFPRYMAGQHRKPIKNRQKLQLGEKYQSNGKMWGRRIMNGEKTRYGKQWRCCMCMCYPDGDGTKINEVLRNDTRNGH